jgi:exodeoxyribonuclease VII large subunit
LVQGAEAPASIVRAIELASQRADVDVLLVCRGGGSLEDLWSFNDERVVRAVAAASMPVVSGVGHETDVTLADLAADLRAPTPTAAAELVAPTRVDLLDALALAAQRMHRSVGSVLDAHAQRLDRMALRLARPGQGVQQRAQRLAQLAHRLAVLAPRATQAHRSRLEQRGTRLQHGLDMALAAENQRLQRLAERLRALDPQRVLARGYAWLADPGGRPITSAQDLAVGQPVGATLHDGAAQLQVLQVRLHPP